jgi:hypothetical protein
MWRCRNSFGQLRLANDNQPMTFGAWNTIRRPYINRAPGGALYTASAKTQLRASTSHYLSVMIHFPASLSRCLSSLRDLQSRRASHESPHLDQPAPLLERIRDAVQRTWDLGFVAFGGPPVHFRILHQRFVEGLGGKEKWVDEQTVSRETSLLTRDSTDGLTEHFIL